MVGTRGIRLQQLGLDANLEGNRRNADISWLIVLSTIENGRDDAKSHLMHDRYAELGRGPLPIEPYISPTYYELEKRHIFKRVWQHVGREAEIPNPGDYFVADLPASDASLIVIRDRDGKINAMHNVCSHRFNKLVYDERGSAGRRLNCKFHGWSYQLDGRLVGVPDEQYFEDFDRGQYGLARAHADVWQGFIFVNVDPAPAVSLADFMRPFYTGLEGYPFDRMTNCYRWQTVVNCNWKLALDAFQETYHVRYVHGRSIADALRTDDNGSMLPIDLLCGDFHRRLSMAGNPKTVYGNPKALTDGNGAAKQAGTSRAGKIAPAALKAGRGATKLHFDSAELPPAINWLKDPDWVFDINVIFPEFYVSTRPNYYQAYNFRPIAHNRTLFDSRVYYPEMKNAGGRFYQEYMKCVLRDVLLEDLGTLEQIQAGCESGPRTHMVLQDYELAVRHNAFVVDRMIREGEERREAESRRKGSPSAR